MNPKLTAVLQVFLFAAMIAVNAMANLLPINGMNTGEISALYPNSFVPAGFTFGIWSVIYLFLLAYVLAGGFILWNGNDKEPLFAHVKMIAPWFLLSCILNAAWIVSWHYLKVVLSLVIMLWLLRTLIGVYQKIQQHRSVITGTPFWTLYIPFVIYLAWICVATIANTTALLVYVQWNALGMEQWIWSCIMIVIAFLLTLFFTYVRGELAFGLVTAWAMFGIYKGQFAASTTVGYTALIIAAASLAFAVIGFLKWNRKTPLEGII
jgi:translocator protein